MKNPLEIFFETWHVIASVGQSDDSIKVVGPKVSLQTLEDRVLYDASPMAAFASDLTDQINTESVEEANLEFVENENFETLEVPVATEFDENDLVLGSVEGDIKFQSARQLIVIDERVEGIEELINDVLEGQSGIDFEIVRLAEDADGIETITNLLDGSQKFDAIHIIGHGGEANVQLGATDLNGDNIDHYQQQLSGWTSGLALGADILLYGCDVAAGSEGELFVERFQSIVGADVAASSDLTGNALLGGDWDFEFIVGEIETNVAFSIDVQQNWTGTLEQVTVTTLDDVVSADADLSSVAALNANAGSDGFISLREAIIAANAEADANVIHLGAGIHTLELAGAGDNLGDLDITSAIEIVGASDGSTVIDAGGDVALGEVGLGERVFHVQSPSEIVVFRDLTIQGGTALFGGANEEQGGGVYFEFAASAELHNVTIRNNSSDHDGGGILSLADQLIVTNSTFEGNKSVTGEGGGVRLFSGVSDFDNVTVSGNHAEFGGGIESTGGIHTFTNLTVSGNEAQGGAGIRSGNGIISIENSTITDNTATVDGGGGIHRVGGAINIGGSIIAGNEASGSIEVRGLINSLGHNIIGDDAGDASGGFGYDGLDLLDQEGLELGVLRDNHGAVQTHELLAGSVGIDGALSSLTTDARGFFVTDGVRDIGAFEQNATPGLQTIVVTTTMDVVDGNTSSISTLFGDTGADGAISLREAIIAVNNGSGGQTILLGAGVHTLTMRGTGEGAGDLDIDRDVQIIGLSTESSVIDGSGLFDVDTMTGERVFDVVNNDATFQYLTITGGHSTSEEGGGIRVRINSEVIVDNVVVTDNHTARSGGGIANLGTLTVTNSTFSMNTAVRDGGGLSSSSSSRFQLNNVTVSNNEADGLGGGVFVINGTNDLTNVTLSGNFAGNGGGIAFAGTNATSVNLTHVTITDNTAQNEGGGIFSGSAQVNTDVQATIVTGNHVAPTDVSGNIDGTNNRIGDDPGLLLDDLADNGGPVQTHALLEGSNAINGTGTAAPGETDARGFLVNDGNRDIGAFEFGATNPTGETPEETPMEDQILDLSSGVEINTIGNNAYLQADDGATVLGGRDAVTIETIFASTSNSGLPTLFSYAAGSPTGNDFRVQFHPLQNELSLFVNGSDVFTGAADFNGLFDGQPHSIAVSWSSASGEWAIYVDGLSVASGMGLEAGNTIAAGGTLLFGQEQDFNGGGFQTGEIFQGTLFDVRVWDRVRTASEIAESYQQKLDPTAIHEGLIANWQFDQFDGSTVTDVVNGSNLSVQNIPIGSGFVSSTPVNDLTVAEDSSTGTSVGFLITTGGDPAATSFDLMDDAGGRFAIDTATGEITVADGSLLNFEENTSHVIMVEVTDGSSTYEEEITIDVRDINEQSMFSNLDATATFVLGGDPVVLDADATIFDAELDAIGHFGGARLQVSEFSGHTLGISGAQVMAGQDIVVSDIIIGTVGGNPIGLRQFDFNSNATNELVNQFIQSITYEYLGTDPAPAPFTHQWRFEDGISQIFVATGQTTVQFVEPTLDLSSNTALEIDENSSNTTSVGFIAASSNGDDSFTYSLSNDAGGRFAIDSATGEITVANSRLLNHETNQSHVVTVAVRDGAGNDYGEDFTITVNNVNDDPTFDAVQRPTFTEGRLPNGADSVVTADIDGDGNLDLVSAAFGTIVWHRNDGAGGFVVHEVADMGLLNARSVTVTDVDGDGNLDLVAAFSNTLADEIVWFRNDGSQSFTPESIAFNENAGANSVTTADVDSDGDIDVLVTAGLGDSVTWYENDGNEIFTRHLISDPVIGADGASSVTTADVDGDGDQDVLFASGDDDTIGWYENDGFQDFTLRVIDDSFLGAEFVATADVDGDGDIDVLGAAFDSNEIAWFENDGSQGFTKRIVNNDNPAEGANSVTTADIDADGDLDILSTSFRDSEVVWYENDGSQGFTARSITSSADGASSIATGDLNGDGHLDVIAASLTDGIVVAESSGNRVDTLDGSTPTTPEGVSVVIDDNVEIFDAELSALNGGLGDFGGATLRVRAVTPSSGHQFEAGGPLSFNGAEFLLDGDTKGTLFASGGDILFTFADGVTNDEVNRIMQSLRYNNTSDAPPASVNFSWNFNDRNDGSQGPGGPETDVEFSRVNIIPDNDAPTITGLDSNVSFIEGNPVVIDADVVLFDAELQASGNYGGATLQLARAGAPSAEDLFSGDGLLERLDEGQDLIYDGQAVGTVNVNSGGQLELQFNSDATDVVVNGVAQSITYANSNDAPPTSVNIEWTFDEGTAAGGGSLSDVANIEVNISAVNDAPDLAGGANPQFDSITEDDIDNDGELISDLLAKIGDPITDPDDNAVEGIAVIINGENAVGTWQYSIDGGTTWQDVGVVSNDSALLLGADDLLRLNPNGVSGGNANLGFRAWDQTSIDNPGDRIDIPGVGGISAFSSQTLSAQIAVLDVNDAPTLDLDLLAFGRDYMTDFVVGNSSVAIVNVGNSSIADVDNPIEQLTVTLADFDPTEAIGDASSTLPITRWDLPDGVVVFVNDGPATNDQFQTLLDSLTYSNTDPSATGSRTLTIVANDGADDSMIATVTVTIVNNEPSVDLNGTVSLTFTENGDPLSLAPGATVDDLGENDIVSLTLTANGLGANNELLFVSSETGFSTTSSHSDTVTILGTDIAYFYDHTAGTITFTNPAGPATPIPADALEVLVQSIRYQALGDDLVDTNIDFEFVAEDASGQTSTMVSSQVDVDPVNDAPVLDTSGEFTLTAVDQGSSGNPGNTVADILASAGGNFITDVDGPAEGIAVSFANSNIGSWQYSIDDGATWLELDSVSPSQTRLLGLDSLIRFEPNPGIGNRTASLSFGAWDQSIGDVGDSIDLAAAGTSISESADTAMITVNANSAPVLSNAGLLQLTEITEDDLNNDGNSVAEILGSDTTVDPITDADGNPEGIAITGLTGNGTWQYDTGNGWTDVGSVSETNALLLGESDRLRYVPDGERGETPTILFQAWDQSDGGVAGTKVDSSVSGGTTAFSDQVEAATITVSDLNDAPVLDNAEGNLLTTIQENDFNSPGDTIAHIIASSVTDADADAVEGIAIFSAPTGNGTWEYLLDGETTWIEFGTLSANSALLLSADAQVRFVPNPNFNGTAFFSYRAWDQTVGIEGDTIVFASNTGGTGTLSVEFDTAQITVNAPPVATDDNYTTTEGGTINVGPATGLLDNDSDVEGPIEVLSVSNAAHGTVSFDTDGSFTYTHDGTETTSDSFTYTIADENGGTAQATVNITVLPVNDAPVYDTSGITTLTPVNENDTDPTGNTIEELIDSAGGDRITDEDVGATEGIALTFVDTSNGSWEYRADSGSAWTSVPAVGPNNALLLGANSEIRFIPNANYSGGANFEFQAWDQTSGAVGQLADSSISGGATAFSTATETGNIFVIPNVAPESVSSASDGTEDNALSIAITGIDSDGTVESFRIINLPANGTLYTDAGLTNQVTANTVINAGPGGALNLWFEPTSDWSGTTSFDFAAIDDDGREDATPAAKTLNIIAVNDAPTLSNNGGTVNEGGFVTLTSSLLEASDVDDEAIGLRYTISSTTNGQLELSSAPGVEVTSFTQAQIDSGEVRFVHDSSETTTASFDFSLADGGEDGASPVVDTFALTVTQANDNPVAVDDGFSTDEDTTYTATLGPNGLLFNDSDVDGDMLTVTTTPVDGPDYGDVIINPDGTFTYTPDEDFFGDDSFTYEITDGNGGSAEATVSITVNAVNDAPLFLDHGFSAIDGTFGGETDPVFIGRAAHFSDQAFVIDTSQIYELSAFARATDANGGPSADNVTQFLGFASYDVDGNLIRTDQVTRHLGSVDTRLAFDLNPGDTQIVLNDATGWYDGNDPRRDHARSIAWYGYQDSTGQTYAEYTYTRNVASNLWDADAISGNVITLREPWSGPALLAGDAVRNATSGSTFNYSLLQAEHVPTTLTEYSATLGGGESSGEISATLFRPGTHSIRLNVISNHTPFGEPTDTDSILQIDHFELNTTTGEFTDGFTTYIEGDAPIALVDTDARIEDVDDVFIESVTIELTNGMVGDILHVDEAALSAIGISVTGVPSTPLTADGSILLTLTADTTESVTRIDFARSLTNVTFENVSEDPSDANRIVNFVANDGEADSAVRPLIVRVVPVNDNPVANDDMFMTDEDVPFIATATNGNLLLNVTDIEGDSLRVNRTPIVDPIHGTVDLNADGTFTYTPDENFHGSDSFTYQVIDENGGVATATVDITVNSVNDDPRAVTDDFMVDEDGTLTATFADLLLNDEDVDGDSLAIINLLDPANGTVAFASDGTFSYTPNADFHGNDSFDYEVIDGNGGRAEGTVNITVNPVNDAPVAVNSNFTTNEDTPLNLVTGSILDNASDPDNNIGDLVIRQLTTTIDGTLTLNPDGTFEYVPDANFVGDDTFTYELEDPSGAISGVATVTITVNAVNDAPVIDLDADDSSGTTGLDFTTSFIQGNGPVSVTDGAAVFDIDSTIQTLTVQISDIPDGADEFLAVTSNPNIGSSYSASTGLLTLFGGVNATCLLYTSPSPRD